MHGPKPAFGVVGVDNRRDIALRRALGNGMDIDAGVPEGAEVACRNAGLARHGVTHHREHRQVALLLDGLQLAPAQFVVKLLPQQLNRAAGGRPLHRHADGVLGAGLGDHHHGDVAALERPEQSPGRAGNPHHGGTFDVDQGYVAHGGDAFDLEAPGRAAADAGALFLRGKGIADVYRDIRLDRRRQRLRMQYLGAEIGQLQGLVVGNGAEQAGIRHQPRICAHNTVHVGPDVDRLGLQQAAHDGGGIVAAVASQGSWPTAGAAGHVAGKHPVFRGVVTAGLGQQFLGIVPVHHRAHFTRLHHQELAGIHHLHGLTLALQEARQQASRPDFTHAGHHVPHRPVGGSHQLGAAQQVAQVLDVVVQGGCVIAQQVGIGFPLARAYRLQAGAVIIARFGPVNQAQQFVGHAFHG